MSEIICRICRPQGCLVKVNEYGEPITDACPVLREFQEPRWKRIVRRLLRKLKGEK